MFTQKNLVPALLLGLLACRPAPEQPAGTPAAPPAAKPARTVTVETPDQVAARFFVWYRTPGHPSQDVLADSPNDHLAEGQPYDTTAYYAVSPAKTQAYLSAMQGSGCLSAYYVGQLRRHIQQYGDSLRAYPQYEGAVNGFDYDWVLDSQDGDEFLTQIEQADKTVWYPAPGRAVVTVSYKRCPVSYPDKEFYLRRYPVGWRIDSISTLDNHVIVEEAPSDM